MYHRSLNVSNFLHVFPALNDDCVTKIHVLKTWLMSYFFDSRKLSGFGKAKKSYLSFDFRRKYDMTNVHVNVNIHLSSKSLSRIVIVVTIWNVWKYQMWKIAVQTKILFPGISLTSWLYMYMHWTFRTFPITLNILNVTFSHFRV